jgi:methylenetetrahydrofolate dehydrogenase (NADP+) / methenyltetrahydrofolate cyclohydrolase
MIMSGKAIADEMMAGLGTSVSALKKHGITPTLVVIQVGNDPNSGSYIKQKQKATERIGAKMILEHFPESVTPVELEAAITHYNKEDTVHGLIVQRPIPTFVGEVGDILNSVSPAKDIDGFIPNSPFEVPVAKAVIIILERIHANLTKTGLVRNNFKHWLNSQKIAIIGRGSTAGKPIASTLKKYDCATSIIHSKTRDPATILKAATIVISCVGKEHIIKRSTISRGAILISVGLSRGSDGKLHGDYDDEAIKNFASFYTPTPGGVGPVNIACLMHNLVDATLMKVSK